MNARREYLEDLLVDCMDAARDVPEQHQGVIIAALVLSDSLNGLRKAILQMANPRQRQGEEGRQ